MIIFIDVEEVERKFRDINVAILRKFLRLNILRSGRTCYDEIPAGRKNLSAIFEYLLRIQMNPDIALIEYHGYPRGGCINGSAFHKPDRFHRINSSGRQSPAYPQLPPLISESKTVVEGGH